MEKAIKLISNESVYFLNFFTFGLKLSLNFSLKTTPKSSANFGQLKKKKKKKKKKKPRIHLSTLGVSHGPLTRTIFIGVTQYYKGYK